MAASQSGLNFISSRAEAIKVPTGYHKITALRLKAYTIMYAIEHFLFIRWARNDSLVAVKIVHLSIQRLSMGSSRSALTSSRNSVQDCLNPICENDCDQPSDFVNENLFSHL
ncbi:unnamed protein product [Rotaria magnacalcarata]|uniref:Uncharacterized protein n=1 Tax=Rotaria magnacalcarata TaxID=392030 RepID=A0A814X6E3_9BILA|nr:unnamed protein product [Rotaria magnacalcarata]CAF3769384.1 unnamed protein product [Rotaria magnacalcarata]CAF3798084.1 unnamed protein product [Rotaria magnacalcarata]CAF3800362.1 unnamed protein product [Rotaria magnacalcarata]CAF4069435.1 unnamed protein product [Rotaria magnacalcarata]